MTNVRYLRRTFTLPESFTTITERKLCVRTCRQPLRSASRWLSVFLTFCMVCNSSATVAQDDGFTYGRTPLGTAPSGAAGGTMVDTNRQGLGVAVRAGHHVGDTVGRNDSASVFGLSPYVNIGNGLLFGDSNLTYSNSGELAWSFGGGYRQYLPAWDAVVGVNSYFDRDQLTGAHFKQWGIGAEVLAHAWEARANWYEPFDRTSTQTGTRINPGSAEFEESFLLFERINTFAEALQGFDAELGILLPGKFAERFGMRAFGGGYSFEGEGLPRFNGVSGRLQADVGGFLELGLKLTDDEVFKTNVNFNVTFHVGGFRSQEHTSRSAMQRMAEPVRRNINIASVTSDVSAGRERAKAPDGTDLTIIHVNSNAAAGGNGTVLLPFNLLQDGLATDGDVVFVHAGSQFSDLSNVELVDDQSLFGEGVVTHPVQDRVVTNIVTLAEVGDLLLPASPTFASNPTLSQPILSGFGNLASPAVTLGNRSTLSGFLIEDAVGTGILAPGVENVRVRDTRVVNSGGTGILLENILGTATLVDTSIENAAGPGFHVRGGAANIGFTSTSEDLDPAFGFITNSAGPAVLIQDTTGGNVRMTTSTTTDTGGDGVIIESTDPTTPIAGGATLDNITVSDSTGTGIRVTNASGRYLFQSTIRDSTLIERSAGDSIQVTGLTASGQVTFLNNVEIDAPGAIGINFDQNAGDFLILSDLSIQNPATTEAMISVTSSTDGGSFVLQGVNTLIGAGAGARGGGTGILISNNVENSLFEATGQTSILRVAGQGVDIQNDASSITFGSTATINNTTGLQVLEPGLQGIRIDNASGRIVFDGTTSLTRTIAAVLPGASPMLDIQNSLGVIVFNNLNVNDSTGEVGVFLLNNRDPSDTVLTSRIAFQDISVLTEGGTAWLASNNLLIRSQTGTIEAIDAAAIDIVDSGIDIELERVDSSDSPTWGIRLENTNKDSSDDVANHPVTAKLFTVSGDAALNPGTGGVIEDATLEGVRLINAGQIRLFGMEINNNLTGVLVDNTDAADPTTPGSGPLEDDDQFVRIDLGLIVDNDIRGVDSTNLRLLDIRRTVFDNNGDAALGAESVFAFYTERPNLDDETVRFDRFDFPYVINFIGNQVTDNSADALFVTHDTGANDAHIGIDIRDNEFFLNAGGALGATPLTDRENAVGIEWNGPALINIENNDFSLAGTATDINARAIGILTDSRTDLLQLEIVNNRIGDLLAQTTTQLGAVGIELFTEGPTTAFIGQNDMIFEGIDSTGMSFTLDGASNIELQSNRMAFREDSGLGIEFVRVTGAVDGGSDVTINDNLIQLNTAFNVFGFPVGGVEEGIIFRRITGVIGLNGRQNNVVEPLQFPFVINNPVQIPAANVNGSIIVNGVTVP